MTSIDFSSHTQIIPEISKLRFENVSSDFGGFTYKRKEDQHRVFLWGYFDSRRVLHICDGYGRMLLSMITEDADMIDIERTFTKLAEQELEAEYHLDDLLLKLADAEIKRGNPYGQPS